MSVLNRSIDRTNHCETDRLIARYILSVNNENSTILIKHQNMWTSEIRNLYEALCSKLIHFGR